MKCSSLINSSTNIDTEGERLLDQPSKEVFIEGRQETIDDIIALETNIMVLSHFWVKIDRDTPTSYRFILKLLIEVVDTLSSAKYWELERKFKIGYEYMAHNVIAYIFYISPCLWGWWRNRTPLDGPRW